MNGDENPFSARSVRPGALPFLFLSGQNAEQLVARLEASGWWGEIVGPHGSGKSTLLAALVRELERAGHKVLPIELHDGQRRVPRELLKGISQSWNTPERGRPARLEKLGRPRSMDTEGHTASIERAPPSIVAVDGYEQLSRWNRFALKGLCRRRGLGLIATAHAPVGLPELFRTVTDLETACAIVERLQRGRPALVTAEDVAARIAGHGGDLRELLFDLYDLYAERVE